MNIKKLFPTLIAEGALPNASSLNHKLLKEIEELSKQDKMGQSWSKENYRGGYTSYASLSDLHYRTPSFSEFEKALEPHAKAFAKAQGWQLKGAQLEMTACWMNIMPKNTYHPLHLHPHSVISGAYYVSTPKQSISLKIEDPRMSNYMNAPLRGKNFPLYHFIEPKAGSFVLFESWVRHEVPPNQSNDPRISISFNYSITHEED